MSLTEPSPSAASRRTDTPVRNVLFIMCDQLRSDHVSCFGGRLHTPNIDRLAERGVRFERFYVNSGVCGPSRTSYYTGRYPTSHRVTWNRVPQPIDERSLGDYLEEHGRSMRLLGKTHFVPDVAGLKASGLQFTDDRAQRLFREGGFDPVERYDGHFEPKADSPYRQYLLARGYRGEQPWTDYVIGSDDAEGHPASGWLMRNAPLPAKVRAEDSETAYLTQRAIDFISEQGSTPWCLHLSYIKPHWPFKAPAPYHDMFGPEDCAEPVRSQAEREHPHPVHAAYQRLEESVTFASETVSRAVRPVYMGLVKQIDDELGRLFDHMERTGRLDDTLVIFSSDHGDLSGDHWLGEKEYFFEPVMRVPFIVCDPSSAAAGTRGLASRQFAESVDVTPTILDALGLSIPTHRVEGRSLLALTRAGSPQAAEAASWRDCVFGQLDYAWREARTFLGRAPHECKGYMVRDERYKYIHWQGYPCQLFDLHDDPEELHDLGSAPALQAARTQLHERLFQWLRDARRRTTESDPQVEARTHAHERMMGIQIGKW